LEILAQTRNRNKINVDEIASKARATVHNVKQTLNEVLPDKTKTSETLIDPETRMKIALEIARHGLGNTAKTLTWQEFETFTGQCLQLAGFETVKGIIAHGQGRKWQIDLIGKKGSMLLGFDCKHWHSSYSPGRLQNAAQHQKDALFAMLNDPKCRKKFPEQKLSALPLILTLLEPQARILDEAVVVPLEKLSDFLNGVTPYSTDFPFIESITSPLENPMSAR
jgi:hypothetical protein